jgi:hypothetical protein
MNARLLLSGLKTYIPGLYNPLAETTGEPVTARYAYAVWLRHLSMAYKSGLPTQPEVVAELGPGNSLGVELAALLSGARTYFAFDVVEYSSDARNSKVFES